ncbi:toll/interleukin-1 receptor domain-containing protein [Kushneria indalinina]|uniref:TIR domain-containing protein n=1 Tax=Kushneria indalinina DSM 14324 TaxID=1122140 RepID=A0A3D9DWF9_9GAMM|nr:toll/interleukin-1 receptor domain-containing protein [Kushneria indalinina]REC94975.1 TIR domain-containing protein [Kushneria indalinina DSM 14324]
MAARVFMSYSHIDEELRDQLEVQLAMLKRQGLVDVWHDRRLLPGDHLDWTINKELNQADIILLLVSPNFLASDYCYKIEKARALERHREGSARLISVILRPCDWPHTELQEFLVTPKDGKPVTQWADRDEAFLNVAQAIRRAIEELGQAKTPRQNHAFIDRPANGEVNESLPRSSNLRLKKEFTKAEEDQFLLDSFEYLGRFFHGSLAELQERNAGIETRYRRIDGNCFTAVVYQNGQKKASCTIRLGGMFGNGISYSQGDDAAANTYNESLSVSKDSQKLFLQAMGMPLLNMADSDTNLSQEGAAEYYWSLLIQPLQGE